MKIALAVETMRDHTTNEGWEIFRGLNYHGYLLCGKGFDESSTDVAHLLRKYKPKVVVVQDKREWDIPPGDFRDPEARFTNYDALRDYDGFKVTILKDSHQKPTYHRQAAEQMGIDSHIIYYDERIVREQAAWLGPVIRTWHTIDKNMVPPYKHRGGLAMLSGAISNAYPLRRRIAENRFDLPLDYLPHPGYHRKGCHTPFYMELLSKYRISICTCSIYKYCLRKIIESVACGCIVITNLPQKYWPPHIGGAIHKINDDISIPHLSETIRTLHRQYEPSLIETIAQRCKDHYDFRTMTRRLTEDIDAAASPVCKSHAVR